MIEMVIFLATSIKSISLSINPNKIKNKEILS